MDETASFQESTKPYIIRAIHEWCVDSGFTPHLLVAVNSQTMVPMAYVKEGEIVLNLNYSATKDLLFTNAAISFSARFGGVSQNLFVPINAVRGIFARENGQGMFFEVNPNTETEASTLINQTLAKITVVESPSTSTSEAPQKTTIKKKPTLTIVK